MTDSFEFECSICVETFTFDPNKRVTRSTVSPCVCPKCSYVACKTCQLTYDKAICTNCKFEFPRSFVVAKLGIDFYNGVVVPAVIKELMVEQRVNLETVDVQKTVEWLDTCKEIRKNSRFGKTQAFPPKPEQTGHVICAKYLCPIGDCPGLVLGETCNACQKQCCVHCHAEKAPNKEHVCSEDAKMVIRDSKPCPKCHSLIHKTEGCNAMFCTKCSTRFDWITLQISETNSNMHYAELIGLQPPGPALAPAQGQDYCMFSNIFDRVPRDALDRYLEEARVQFGEAFVEPPHLLFEFLYKITAAVREHKNRLFKEEDLITVLHSRMHDLRVQYLTKKINTKVWEKRVYFHHVQYKTYMVHASAVNIYLSITDGLLRENIIHNTATVEIYETMVEQLERLTTFCNESFADLHKDYPIDSTPLYIRNIHDSEEDVFDDCGFVIAKNERATSFPEFRLNPDAKPIVLYEYQKEHTAHLFGVLEGSHFALDLSMLGAGKSFTAMALYRQRQYSRGLIIAPASVVGKWKELLVEYGLSGIEVHSFNLISGIMGKNSRTGHLVRRSDKMTAQGNVVAHRVTSQMQQYIREGIFIVIDEIQNIKNDNTAQTSACKELICAVHREYLEGDRITCTSRVLLISGSPINNHNNSVQLFKNIGVISEQHNTQQEDNGKKPDMLLTELVQVREFCQTLDQQTSLTIQQKCADDKKKAPQEECYEYFTQVLKPQLSGSMVVVGNTHVVQKFNGLFDIIPPCATLMKRANKILTMCLHFNRDDHNHGQGGGGGAQMFSVMQKGLLMGETAMIPTIVRLTREHLAKNPMCKVVIACNYTQTITDLVRELEPSLAPFAPLVLNGQVPTSQRQAILSPFQEPNANSRLLIGNLHVLSTGIDLDDKDGGYPRVCLVIPNYNAIDLYQLSYRFLRALDTKSDSEMYLLYAKQCPLKTIMKNLTKKGNVMKTVTTEQSDRGGVIFPCDFVDYEHTEPFPEEVWQEESQDIFDRLGGTNLPTADAV